MKEWKPRMDTDGHGSDLRAFDTLTEAVIGCAFRVSNTLGCGFLEKVYENAMVVELREAGLTGVCQKSIEVRYRDTVVGRYVADLLVEDVLLVELKATHALDPIHEAQCLNYLKATGLRLCLLLNFGRPKIEIKRLAR